MKNKLDYLIIFVLITLLLGLGYYIAVNTVLHDTILPNIYIGNKNISLKNETSVLGIVTSELNNKLENIEGQIDGQQFSIPLSNLNIKIDNQEILNYGKGYDIAKVIREGISLIEGKQLQPGYSVDINDFLSQLPLKLNSRRGAYIQNNKVERCESGEYKMHVDTFKLESLINEYFKTGKQININISEVVLNPSEIKIIEYCKKKESEKVLITNKISEIGIKIERINFDKYFQLNFTPSINWSILDEGYIKNSLKEIAKTKYKASYEGEYVVKNNQIFLTKNYKFGTEVDIDKSFEELVNWLNNLNSEYRLSYKEVKPKILSENKEIINFTKVVAAGKTRIDLIRAGRPNWVVPHAQSGVEEMNNIVINPGEIFSYIDTIKPQLRGEQYYTINGRVIAGGICNSTTTLFRAALEAGLPIVERQSHTMHVESYEWGYPINIVDAAYYTSPRVDLKFKNDYNFPLLLKTEITRDNNGYQYHTIYIHTNPAAKNRKVELTNWSKWNVKSPSQFSGSFERMIYEDGNLKKKDKFISRYN